MNNKDYGAKNMEVHFPHLTNGIARTTPTRRQRARTFRKLALSSAIALAAVVGVIGASSAKAEFLFNSDAEMVIAKGEILHVKEGFNKFYGAKDYSKLIRYDGKVYYCHSTVHSEYIEFVCRYTE